MIELRDVKYGGAGGTKPATRSSVDLDVSEGDFVSIIGSSGSGKSTLLHIIGMLERPSGGRYNFNGQEIGGIEKSRLDDLRMQNFGFILRDYPLNVNLTVYENIELPLMYRDLTSAVRSSRVTGVLERFHLSNLKNLFPFQLSKVQQRLVAIARAMVTNPRLILAEDPTGDLAPNLCKGIRELFRALNRKGVTIIQTGRSLKDASFSNRIVDLDGKDH